MIEHGCRIRGASRLGYPPVVAGGCRANTLHYVKNDCTIDHGELVLMDAGAEYAGYNGWVLVVVSPQFPLIHRSTCVCAWQLIFWTCSLAGDISRTWPVSGEFTPAQRDVYEAVLRVQEHCIKLCTADGMMNLLRSAHSIRVHFL